MFLKIVYPNIYALKFFKVTGNLLVVFTTILQNAKQKFSEGVRIHLLGHSILPWVVNFCLYFR